MSGASIRKRIIIGLVSGVVAAGLVGTTLAVSLTHSVIPMSLAAGDSVLLLKARAMVMPNDRLLQVYRADMTAARKCILDPYSMAVNGGSMLITAVREDLSAYEVHWQGLRTYDKNSDDCGASADLLMPWEQIATVTLLTGVYIPFGGAVPAAGERPLSPVAGKTAGTPAK